MPLPPRDPLHLHVRRLATLLLAPLLLLVGCGSSSSSNPPPCTQKGSATITGLVTDDLGQPLSNRKVVICSASTTTGANGQFTLTGVATPYDVAIIEPAPSKIATIYNQLTRTDPKLLDIAISGQPGLSATLGGTISGGTALDAAGTLTAVSWASPGVSLTSYVNTSPYSIDLGWAAPASITGTVRGLQVTVDPNFTVTGYPGYAAKTGVTVASGGTVSDADLPLAAVTTDSISANISAPAGHEIVERNVFLSFDDGAFVQVSGDGLDAGAFQVPVPSNIGAKASILAHAVTSNGSSETFAQSPALAPGTVGAALTLPAPAQLTAADGGVDTTTDLAWTPVSGGIHALLISATANDPAYAIVSGGSRARIPDLSSEGLGLPSGRPYDVVLIAIGPYASVDAYTETTVYPASSFGFETVSYGGFTTK